MLSVSTFQIFEFHGFRDLNRRSKYWRAVSKPTNNWLSPCFEDPNKMLKASNLKAPGFSLGFGVCNPLRAESTPEGLSYGSVSSTGKVHHVQFDKLLEISRNFRNSS